MPFSNDEIITEEKLPRLKHAILLISAGLFVIALFGDCFVANDKPQASGYALMAGWLAGILAWWANPLLFLSWFLLLRNKGAAWFFALAALLLMLSFLNVRTTVTGEDGRASAITALAWGYWAWVASAVTTFAGSLAWWWKTRR